MIFLDRFKSSKDGTFGMMTDDKGNQLCFTMERPWIDNQPEVSCIPPGHLQDAIIYNCINYSSPKFPHAWQVCGVPGRQDILIHNGNTDLQTHGCILVGDSMGTVNGLPAVLNSVKTLERLKTVLPDMFELQISDSESKVKDAL